MNRIVLIGVPPKEHVLLANDEVSGLQDNGFICKTVAYSRNDQTLGVFNKLLGVIKRAFGVVCALYKHKPAILYLNSRIETAGSTRDFISILIIKCFYFRPLKIAIKSHGSELHVVTGSSFFFKRLVTPFLTQQVHAWFVLSKEEKATIENSNRKMGECTHVTSNIIDPARSQVSDEFCNKFKLDKAKFKILYAGRMIEKKGVFQIVEAIQKLEFRSNCQFIMVGNGPMYNQLVEAAKKNGADQYITFTGFVPEVECNHFYSNTDVLLYPTYDSEGFPMSIFKAVAAGQLVVTTQIRAAKDHLTSPENVVWVEPQSVDSIVEAISRLYHNKALREAMRVANIKKGRSFSKAAICTEMGEVFKTI
jgi:glycosyltransferase involved in cell wall biosynthesis